MYTILSTLLFAFLATALPHDQDQLLKRSSSGCKSFKSYASAHGGLAAPSTYCSSYLSIPLATKTKTVFAKSTVTDTVTQDGIEKTVTASTHTVTSTATPSTTIQVTVTTVSTDSTDTPVETVFAPATLCNGQPTDFVPSTTAAIPSVVAQAAVVTTASVQAKVRRDASSSPTISPATTTSSATTTSAATTSNNLPEGMQTLTGSSAISSACSCLSVKKSTTTVSTTKTKTTTKLVIATTTSTPSATTTITLQSTNSITSTTTSTATVYINALTTTTQYTSADAALPTAFYISMAGGYVSPYYEDEMTLQSTTDNAVTWAPPDSNGQLNTADGTGYATMDTTNDPSQVDLYPIGTSPLAALTCQINVDSSDNTCTLGCSSPSGTKQYTVSNLVWSVGSDSIMSEQAEIEQYYGTSLGYAYDTPSVVVA